MGSTHVGMLQFTSIGIDTNASLVIQGPPLINRLLYVMSFLRNSNPVSCFKWV